MALVLSALAFDALAAGEAIRRDAGAVAREIFDDPEFWWKGIESIQGPDVPAPPIEYLARAVRWLARRVIDLLRILWPSGHPLGFMNLSRYVVWAVLILWLVSLVVRWRDLWVWIKPKLRSAGPVGPADRVSTALPDVARLLEQASMALDTGDGESVVRFGFLAVIAWLETHDLIPANRARTNREHLEALRESPAVPFREGFRRLARPYERVWYGQQTIAIGDARSFLSDCRTFMVDGAVAS